MAFKRIIVTRTRRTFTPSRTSARTPTPFDFAQGRLYDSNGNLKTRPNGALTYDAENRLTSITQNGTTTAFVYDGDGNRVKKTVGATTTYYVGNYFEVTGSTATKYYYFGRQRVAMRVGTNATIYLHGDHLGSTSATSGASVSSQTYYAYGNIRTTTGSVPTDYGFTGQKRDASSGLMYYNARYYDSALGRFIQADTIVPNAANPQDLNRYAYVRNNPLKYIDPSGHDLVLIGGGPGTDPKEDRT